MKTTGVLVLVGVAVLGFLGYKKYQKSLEVSDLGENTGSNESSPTGSNVSLPVQTQAQKDEESRLATEKANQEEAARKKAEEIAYIQSGAPVAAAWKWDFEDYKKYIQAINDAKEEIDKTKFAYSVVPPTKQIAMKNFLKAQLNNKINVNQANATTKYKNWKERLLWEVISESGYVGTPNYDGGNLYYFVWGDLFMRNNSAKGGEATMGRSTVGSFRAEGGFNTDCKQDNILKSSY
jgi:hypothetical protein